MREFDWDLISNKKVVGVNDAYRLGPWVDYNIFGDMCWHSRHRRDMRYSTATHVGITNQPGQNQRVKWMRRKIRRLGEKPGELGWFNNTGMSGICLAVQLGATRVCLLGFDMKIDEESGEANWHVNEISSPNPGAYPRFMSQGRYLRNELEEKRPDVEVLNCNPDSAMDLWPKVKLEEVL